MLFSRKDLSKLILPLIAQQILTVLVGMVDSMMVSSAGETAVSGVSLITTLDVLLITLFNAMVTGGGVVVAQAIGRKDMKLVRDSAKQLLYSAFIVALAVSVLGMIFRKPLLNLLYGDVEQEVMKHALDYFFYMLISFPFLAITSAGGSLFRNMGNSMTPMVTSLMTNGLNVCGNAIFIYGYNMAAGGAALATLIARIITAVVMLGLLHNRKNLIYLEKLWHYRPNFKIIKRILQIGVPSGIEGSMFQFGKLIVQSLVSTMGTVSIAANAVASYFANLQYMAGTAVNTATVPVVGRCIGAGERKQAIRYSRLLVGIVYICIWATALIIFVFGKPLVGLYHLGPDSADMAQKILILHSLMAIIFWSPSFNFPNSFRAAGDVRFTMYIAIISMWAFRVALGYVFSLETINLAGLQIPGLGMGVTGVWLAMGVDWAFRAGIFAWRHFSGRWLEHTKSV